MSEIQKFTKSAKLSELEQLTGLDKSKAIEKLVKLAELTADTLTGEVWRKLSSRQKKLVTILEEEGFLLPNTPSNSFVGRVPYRGPFFSIIPKTNPAHFTKINQ